MNPEAVNPDAVNPEVANPEQETPRALGFRMPAEWEPHEATWIAWPHNEDDWPGRFEPIPWVYGEIVRKLSQVERVRILLQNDDVEQNARNVLDKCGVQWEAVEFYPMPTDRVWARDFAPLFVKNPARRSGRRSSGDSTVGRNTRIIFDDEAAGAEIPRLIGVDIWRPEMVLEGGSVDVNGAGLLLTTEECLLSPIQARNPDLSREEIETALGDYLGIDRVLWLRNGIAGDDTHGHIDDLARFTGTDTVVIVSEDDRSDVNYEPLRENWEILLKSLPRARAEAAHAGAALFRGPAPSGELCELLYRQPDGAGSDLQRSERPGCAERACRMLPGPAGGRDQLRGTHLGTGDAALHDAAATGGWRVARIMIVIHIWRLTKKTTILFPSDLYQHLTVLARERHSSVGPDRSEFPPAVKTGTTPPP